jgi:hypothetical protein
VKPEPAQEPLSSGQHILRELEGIDLAAVEGCRKLGSSRMLDPRRSELCRKREASTMVRRFAPWLIHQLNMAMSIRLGIRMTDEQVQRIRDSMQEMIEDVLTDYGMRPVFKTSRGSLIILAATADCGSTARPSSGGWLKPDRKVPALSDG